ncbi:exopolysaccharide biosynthesis protein [Rhizobium sp. R72]|uniref:Wzz/FepE/Etk N-terminal domain-containing protein n=1 Tax=unclassified Rhizobium TaxID=2613769 RepID=UPI000B52CC13|nr:MULTISPECIES: Wzz/FepE/Etk N-terminal domain-containing protein [unclassified Rhizobium]OWV96122.1 exopolysaccharide biosynthesis protein [Rhizobium sp. R72]OWV96606.1 exopolysaccharide biosynthesis protein [Rhizobium sp. R711]
MMFNRPRPLEATSRLWRLDETQPESTADGPLVLLRAVIALSFRHKVSLVACTIAGLVLAGLYAHSLPPIFTSTATLLLEPRQSAASGQEFSLQQGFDLNRADSELQTIRSERLLSSVFESLGLIDSAELDADQPGLIDRVLSTMTTAVAPSRAGIAKSAREPASENAILVNDAERAAFLNFAKRLNARRVGQSFVIEVDYSSSDPTLPARVANAVVSGYIFQAIAFKEQMARAGTEALQGRLDSLSGQMEAARQAMHEGSLPAIPTPDADARVIGAALTPLGPSAPRKTLITALGGVLGLLAGLGLVAVRLALDRKVRDARDLSRDSGIACLGTIPVAPDATGVPRKVDARHLGFVRAIHDLRTSVEIACTSLRSETSIAVAVVSWRQGAGVTMISTSLAQLIRRNGRHVTLFQNPQALDGPLQEQAYGLPTASLADAAFAGLSIEEISFGTVEGVVVLPIHSRDTNANLFTDFRNPRVQRIMEAARSKGDVILDLPPLHASMDALALCAYADAVIVVAQAGETTIEEVVEAVQLLRRAGANVVGTVLNKARR